jgi:hypothetical protein
VLPPTRRAFLASVAGALAIEAARSPGRARAAGPLANPGDGLQSRAPPDFTVLDLEVEGDKKIATRFTLFVPNHLAKDEKVPLLVLLHGLGETWDTGIGVYAWVERYGLGTAYARLRRPPLARAWRSGNLFTDARLAEINASLAALPFRGMAVACPFTPNVARLPDPDGALDAYAAWIADVVVPRARKEAPILPGAAHTALDGVSLGGYVGVEVFIRRPQAFGVWGGVQSAFNPVRVPQYADKLAAALSPSGKTSVRIATTDLDPFREANGALAAALAKKGLPTELFVSAGMHDQLYLREAGTVEMLLWHDRRLRLAGP